MRTMSPSTPRRSGAAEICGFATPEGLVKPWQGLAEFGARTQMVEPITSLLDPQCSDDASAAAVLWTTPAATEEHISIPMECTIAWSPRGHPVDMAIVCPGPVTSRSLAFLCSSFCVFRWSPALRAWKSETAKLEVNDGSGLMLPVVALVVRVDLRAVCDALTLMHASLYPGAAGGAAAPPPEKQMRERTIGDYISQWTSCAHVRHKGAQQPGSCGQCASSRMRQLTYDHVVRTWDYTGYLVPFEARLSPLGALLTEWRCLEMKVLLQKAANRVMYARCTSKPGKGEAFRLAPSSLTHFAGPNSSSESLRIAMDIAAASGLHYHRAALASYAQQFVDQLCFADGLPRHILAMQLPEVDAPHRSCWHEMTVAEA